MIIREKDRDKLIKIFSEVKIPMEVWAYGSRVRGTAHNGSDLDLVIRRYDLKKVPDDVMTNLMEAIRDSTIPILVQLFDWARIPESFKENISNCYEVFYKGQISTMQEPPAEYGVTDKEK